MLAKVSQHVTSKIKPQPCVSGIKQIPSRRMQSDLNNEGGSSLDGISAVARDLLVKSLSALCRIIRTADLTLRRYWGAIAPQSAFCFKYLPMKGS